MAYPIRYNFIASSTTYVAAAQTLAGAGNMVLDGSGSEVSPTRRMRLTGSGFSRPITLTSTGNISGVNFTITGTDIRGAALVEVLAGPNNNTVSTTGNFYSVTSISANGAVSTATSAGIGSTGVSQWTKVNYQIAPTNIGLGINVTGTINYTAQQTTANVETAEPAAAEIQNHYDASLVSQTASKQGNYNFPFGAYRLLINSSTGGSLTFDSYQAGISNH